MSNIKNISAENCYSTIKENKDAYLVDVRTPYEWETFGRVDEDSFDAQYIESVSYTHLTLPTKRIV